MTGLAGLSSSESRVRLASLNAPLSAADRRDRLTFFSLGFAFFASLGLPVADVFGGKPFIVRWLLESRRVRSTNCRFRCFLPAPFDSRARLPHRGLMRFPPIPPGNGIGILAALRGTSATCDSRDAGACLCRCVEIPHGVKSLMRVHGSLRMCGGPSGHDIDSKHGERCTFICIEESRLWQ